MKRIIVVIGILLGVAVLAHAGENYDRFIQNQQNLLMKPYTHNAYGLGSHSDATGRPFEYRTEQGESAPGFIEVKPDAYGLGVHMDQFGRPVRAYPR